MPIRAYKLRTNKAGSSIINYYADPRNAAIHACELLDEEALEWQQQSAERWIADPEGAIRASIDRIEIQDAEGILIDESPANEVDGSIFRN